jgi:hypothetical protein
VIVARRDCGGGVVDVIFTPSSTVPPDPPGKHAVTTSHSIISARQPAGPACGGGPTTGPHSSTKISEIGNETVPKKKQ